jgi:hypothetical protein
MKLAFFVLIISDFEVKLRKVIDFITLIFKTAF